MASRDYDDPYTVASAAAALPPPVLVGLDVDGVLAPIVAHADDAELLPGIDIVVAELAEVTPVAIVSGRSLDDLARFGFPAQTELIGLHGMERRGRREVELSEREVDRLGRLAGLAESAAERAGEGAWVERKPAGVVLHVREARPEHGAAAADELVANAVDITGVHVKVGHAVVELLARVTSKSSAVAELRRETGATSVVFVGDDVTDEEVFARLQPRDCSIRVGDGPTAARHRFAGPPEVLLFLDALRTALSR